MVRKNGLGKGLDSLIPSTGHKKAAPAKPEVKKEVVVEKVIKKEEVMVKITEVEPNREQPRKNFNEDALLELADSIKQFGIIQPLVVQKQDDYYEIIAGERRWRAAKLAGLKEVPVIIKNYTEQERVEIALIENIQREDLNPIEEAMAFKRLLTEFDLKQDELAERVSKSRTAVTNSMRLLKLDERVQQMVVASALTVRAFAPITFSIIALLVPIALTGYAALSVERQITFFTPESIAAVSTLSVPKTFVFTASRGKNSQFGTCLSAAAWNT